MVQRRIGFRVSASRQQCWTRTRCFWTRRLTAAKARERSPTTRLRAVGGGIKNMPRNGWCPLPAQVLMDSSRNQRQVGGRQLQLLLLFFRRTKKLLRTLGWVFHLVLENFEPRILRQPLPPRLEARNARNHVPLLPLLQTPRLLPIVLLHPNRFSNLNPQNCDANNLTFSAFASIATPDIPVGTSTSNTTVSVPISKPRALFYRKRK